jgi:hypothetical protein
MNYLTDKQWHMIRILQAKNKVTHSQCIHLTNHRYNEGDTVNDGPIIFYYTDELAIYLQRQLIPYKVIRRKVADHIMDNYHIGI